MRTHLTWTVTTLVAWLVGMQANPAIVTQASVDVDGDGRVDTVSVVMTSGRRLDDSELWCGGQREKYVGSFAIVVETARGRVETPLDPLLGGSDIWFDADPWTIVTADYNHDGEIDFNLGQYHGCNYWSYTMFSVKPSGQVERSSGRFLVSPAAPPGPPMLFSGLDPMLADSTYLTPVADGFRCRYYDNSRGASVETVFRWSQERRMFEKVSEQLCTNTTPCQG